VGVAEQGMIVKGVDANQSTDLDGQASLGCIGPQGSSWSCICSCYSLYRYKDAPLCYGIECSIASYRMDKSKRIK
jgi:hypothetical protein